ncbi:MAG: hypothetical protein HY286_09275 [Planctomycetes bacterium]|nr:hypothetical protein [Planctomycetota bacterium]
MLKDRRYPVIALRSKNELAKRISGKDLPYPDALALINDVLQNFDAYWYDSDRSEPKKEKYVRSAIGKPLGKLLKLIDRKILAPHDSKVPGFIFGGLSGKNHIQAAYHLLGEKRKRTLLRLDIKGFFEQIHEERVFHLFNKKFGCSVEAAQLIARLCCVAVGPKNSGSTKKTLARGFATSPRLALWCNLDLFLRLQWKMKRVLRHHDPRITIFVDDIGVTASRIEEDQMRKFSTELENILAHHDPNQSLRINPQKKEILTAGMHKEHLGLQLGRNRLSIGKKTRFKRNEIAKALKQPQSEADKKALLKKRHSYFAYQEQIKNIS